MDSAGNDFAEILPYKRDLVQVVMPPMTFIWARVSTAVPSWSPTGDL